MKMYLQKEISRKTFLFIWFLLASWRSMTKKQDLDPLVRGFDPRIRIHTKMSSIRNISSNVFLLLCFDLIAWLRWRKPRALTRLWVSACRKTCPHALFPASISFLSKVGTGYPINILASVAIRIRIRIGRILPWSLLSSSKNSKKNLDSYCFLTSFWLFILEKLCTCAVPSKVLSRKLF